MKEQYTPGSTQNATDFMAKRTLSSHGKFFLPYITEQMYVLDCGCGPGTITCDIAQRVPNGQVVGVDADLAQVKHATEQAKARSIENITFRDASAYNLPFDNESFHAVFSHALLEHLGEPVKALSEFHRILQPGGILAVCSPDWGGFLFAPPSEKLTSAIDTYKTLQLQNGGDVYVGRKFAQLFEEAHFEHIKIHARYEVYDSLQFIGEYLAIQLDNAEEPLHATTLREWAAQPNGMFAQTWVSCVGQKGT